MSKRETRRKRARFPRERLTCKPLESLDQIKAFLENPPPWRNLCKEFAPHSKSVIRNIEHIDSCEPELEYPEIYCHFNPDAEAPKRYDVTEKKLPKTLVCHDMANGYHDDSEIEGTQNYDAYTFYNWAGIDIFCYFSHHFITIPPVSWISVGHEHGVKVIGTIITEWAEGTQLWDNILSSEPYYRDFACAVVAIAKTMKFDGWLLNIENKISYPDKLLEFIRYLHKVLHEELVDPVLIWYDSVTITGHLNWQNGLNAKNKAFFDICDGFFTNYSWSLKDVEDTVKLAGDRLTDVYLGIDVWGRNFYGGGQFNTQTAVKIAHNAGCSLAIFAPAWTHEAITDTKDNSIIMPEALSMFEQFMLRDRALWDSLWPFLYTHLPCKLPFQTSFCMGQGKKRWMYGEVISPGPWYNLRHQQYQPNSAHGPHGYILSSKEQLMKVSFVRRSKKGIIKYRRELEALRSGQYLPLRIPSNENVDSALDSSDEAPQLKIKESFVQMETIPSEISNKEEPEVTKVVEATHHEESVNEVTDDAVHSIHASDSHSKSKGLKSFIDKLKDVFKKHKSDSRKSSIEEPRTSLTSEGAEEGPSTGHEDKHSASAETSIIKRQTEGQSMVTMSVNLNLQPEELVTRWMLAHVSDERQCLALYLDDAFNGGACLKVNPSDKISTDHRTIRLFHCDFQCQDTLIVCVVTKTLVQYTDQALNVKLFMKNAKGEDLRVILMSKSLGLKNLLTNDSVGIVYSYPVNSEKDADFLELRRYLLLHEPGFYVPLENLYGWTIRYHIVHVEGSRLTEVNCRTTMPQGGILLGHLGICHRKSDTDKSSAS